MDNSLFTTFMIHCFTEIRSNPLPYKPSPYPLSFVHYSKFEFSSFSVTMF